jgi:hypothetical protein
VAPRREFQVKLEGPFFERDVRRTVRANIRDLMDKLAAEAEADVKAQMDARAGQMPHWTGHTRSRVVGRTQSLRGRRWEVSAVVSVNTDGMSRSDAIRTKAAGAQMEARFRMFRRTAAAMRRARAILSANLTKGLE